MTTNSLLARRHSFSPRAVGLICAALAAAVLLALAVPAVQQLQAKTACARLGGDLRVATEIVEPVVAVRTVYRCYGPGGRVLGTW